MTQQEKEKMFLDLNGVLVKFWIEQGRPDKEVKIELLERMLNWYKKMGYVIPDGQSKEPVTEDLEEAVKLWVAGVFLAYTIPDVEVKLLREIVEKSFIAGAEWQKQQSVDGTTLML